MASRRAPWNPEPKLVDPLIALLCLFELLLVTLSAIKHPLPAQGQAGTLQPMLSQLSHDAQMIRNAAILLMLLGGFTVGILFLADRHLPRPEPPRWAMSGRAAALVLLGWHAASQVIGTLTLLALRGLPQGRLLSLPLGYGLSAALGVWMLMRAEGLGWQELRARAAPGKAFSQAAWGPALLALGFLLAFLATLAFSRLLRGAPRPQVELMELLRSVRGFIPTSLLLLTVAGVAPFFEELLFRGFLLPWMRERWGWGRALAASSLAFGLFHLQPTLIPALSALGLGFGLGVWRTGSVRGSMVAHALWNGGIFLMVRLAAG
ncbi:MAG TPA: type II CAAX endopeptidase family protein [Holophagaceae bacterium]|nr:type II CAAX endopeptidase family protein [Holophagaceae bacterium]